MRFKTFFNILAWTMACLVIACLCLYIGLPHIAEHELKRKISFMPAGLEFRVDKIGLSRAVVSDVSIGSAISVSRVSFEYKLSYGSGFFLDRIILAGLTIHAFFDENHRLRLQGIEFPAGSARGSAAMLNPGLAALLPEKLVLQNADIVIHSDGFDTLVIPVNGTFTIKKETSQLGAKIFIYPFGEKIIINASYDLSKKISNLEIKAARFDLAPVNRVIAGYGTGFELSGTLGFDAGISIDNKKISSHGSLTVSTRALPALPLRYSLMLDRAGHDRFRLELWSAPLKLYEISGLAGSGSLCFANPEFRAEFSGNVFKNRGRLNCRIGKIKIHDKNININTGPVSISSAILFDFTDGGKGADIGTKISAENFAARFRKGSADFNMISLSGKLKADKTLKASAAFEITGSGGQAGFPGYKTRVSGIEFKMPMHYPAPLRPSATGVFSIDRIRYDKSFDFFTKGKIVQAGMYGCRVNGRAGFEKIPGLSVRFSSLVSFEEKFFTAVKFSTNIIDIKDSGIKELISDLPEDSEISGMASVWGKVRFSEGSLKTGMDFDLQNGKIRLPDMDLTASGINTRIKFSDIVAPASVPGQIIRIDSLNLGRVRVRDARVRFTLENLRSLLVENIRFRWCGGLVSTESMRIPEKDHKYFVTLYCDRLKMTQLLKQMGVFDASGSGTLNGRIPVVYSGGNIGFDNGFLFSTPGRGGKLIIMNTEKITSGLPMDSPQFAQLDLAKEALKDFNYKWARLVFNTKGDTLEVKMQINGRPSNVLPFEYKKQFGRFVRVDSSSRGSRFQGIRLDVNLKLPFNDVLKFGNKIQSILK